MTPAALHPFDGLDLWSLVEERATWLGDQPALTWAPFDRPPRRWTFAEVRREASALAAGLQYRGVETGDRVLIHLDNSPEFVFAWLACAAIGATAVTTNTRSSVDELRYYADVAGVVGAITQPRLRDVVATAAPGVRWIACADHDGGEPARAVEPGERLVDLLREPEDLVRRAPNPRRALSVQFTSGTTDRPKGVVWTHANALWSALTNAANEDLRSSDRHLVYLPLFHTNSITFSVLPSLWVGAEVVLTPKWSTSRFWDISLRHRCTWSSLIGLSIRAITSGSVPDGHDYRLFGTGISADELPGTGVKTIGWWGMTETVAPAIVGSPHLPNRFGAIGRPSPHYGVAIVDDNGDPTAVDETGHLLVRGTPGITLFDGYLDDAKATANAFDEDGWFRTGDLVARHHDGYISFIDRHKDVIRVGAENVAASEVERVIAGVPGVTEAAVVARTDVKLDEVPVAFVRSTTADPAALAEAVRAACASLLADFKVPRSVQVVRELPRSTLSKIDKRRLRSLSDGERVPADVEAEWIAAAATDPSGDDG